ncbi:hypothetical protein [Streptomyces griseus]|uniref:hypothetical protein n=1 Tax=Streptomyces griseus TaxID=1911 RepID=UPI000B0913CA|nr:hypothetical protein [Streptomyces griseus]
MAELVPLAETSQVRAREDATGKGKEAALKAAARPGPRRWVTDRCRTAPSRPCR